MSIALVGTPSSIISGGSYTAEAGSDRLVVFSVASMGDQANITAVAMGAQAATEGVTQRDAGGGNDTEAAHWYIKEADIPTGSQTVTITDIGVTFNHRITCYTLSGVEQTSTVDSTAVTGGTGATASWSALATTAQGFSFANVVYNSGSAGGITTTWTGATEQEDSAIGVGRYASAYKAADGSIESGTFTRINARYSCSAIAFAAASVSETPLLSDPTYADLVSLSVTPKVTTDGTDGTIYQVIALSTATAPNATQMKAGTDGDDVAGVDSANQAVVGAGVQTFAGTGDVLDPGTDYIIYYYHESAGASESNIVSIGITTTGTTQTGNIELVHTVGGIIDTVIPAPVLSSSTATLPTFSGLTGGITLTTITDTDNGVISMVVVPDNDSPSVDQIKQGLQSDGTAAIVSGSKPISATGAHSFVVTGLTIDTDYEAYFVHTNITNTDSASDTVGFNIADNAEGTVLNTEAYIKSIRNIGLGSDDPVTISTEQPYDATYTDYYCMGRTDYFQGKAMWVRVITTDTAREKATEIISVMFQDGNNDPDIGP